MEVALTFGSLGDIIQLVQLAIQLGRAIGVGKAAVTGTSAKEYQELRHDLDILVVATYQQHELGTPLHVLDKVTKSVVDQFTVLIQDALDHLQSRYGSSLTKEGSGSKVKDVYKKVEWCMREKDRLRVLHEKLQAGMERLNLLSTLSARKSARVDNATLLARIDQVQELCRDKHEQVLELLEKQKLDCDVQFEKQTEQLGAMQIQLSTVEQKGSTLLSMASDALKGILEVKDLLVSMSQAVISLQISATQTQFMRSLDPTKELSVTLEDSLGRHIPIPAEWLDTLEWAALNSLLVGLFQGKKGQDMIRRQAYALEESASGRDISSDRPLSQCLRRGMKINMSMIFFEDNRVAGGCPRCHTLIDALEGVNILCPVPDCGMWFRMQKMVVKDVFAAEDGAKGLDDAPVTKDSTVVTSIPAEPGDFMRVRLLRMPLQVIQPEEAIEMESEADLAVEDVSGEAVQDLGVGDPYDADHDSISTKGRHTRRRKRSGVYIDGQRVEMSHPRNKSEERLSKLDAEGRPGIYVNGKRVDLDQRREEFEQRFRSEMYAKRRGDTTRERVLVVPNPPTARTPPVNFTTLTPPVRFHDPSVSREHRNRPYMVDERPRIVEPHGRPRYVGTPDGNEERGERRLESERTHERRREAELRERIERANNEIANRPASSAPLVPIGVRTWGEESNGLLDAVKREQARKRRKDEELRERIERARVEIANRPAVSAPRLRIDVSTAGGGYNAHSGPLKIEIDERTAQEQRLRERMLPSRRASIGPGSRRPRAIYDDGLYRWE